MSVAVGMVLKRAAGTRLSTVLAIFFSFLLSPSLLLAQAPEFTHSVGSNGDWLTLTADEPVQATVSTGFELFVGSDRIDLTYLPAESTSTELRYELSRRIHVDEDPMLSYDRPAGGWESMATGTVVEDFSWEVVQNNSIQKNMEASESHWITLGSAINVDPQATLAGISNNTLQNFRMYVPRYYWAMFEKGNGSGTTSGQFDFTAFGDLLDDCQSRGIMCGAFIMWRRFETSTFDTPFAPPFDESTDVVPADLASGFQFGGGGQQTAMMYESTPRIRFEKMLKAVYDQFGSHPAFSGVFTSETAGMQNGPGYSLNAYVTELNNLHTTMSEYAFQKGCGYFPGWNFLADVGPGNLATTGVDAWEGVWDGVRRDNVVPWTPDILQPGIPPNSDPVAYSGVDNQVYPILEPTYVSPDGGNDGLSTEFQEFQSRASSMQMHSYGTADGNLDYDMDQQFVFGRDVLKVDVVIWTYQNWISQNKFDQPHDGQDLGDAHAVARLPWEHPYDAEYAFSSPTVTASVGPNGDWLTLTASRPLEVTNASGFTLRRNCEVVGSVYLPAESTTTEVVYELSETIDSDDVLTLSYERPSTPGVGWQAIDNGADLVSFDLVPAANNSTQPAP